jgi:two-component sensor histidine kinase
MPLNRIYLQFLRNRERRYAGFLMAVIAALVAGLLRHLIDDVLTLGFPFLTFFPAVTLIAFVYGPRPGAVTAVLSGLIAWYFFVQPFNSFVLTSNTLVALLFYMLIVATILVLVTIADQAFQLLRKQQAMAEALAEQRSMMFQELQHRVANNLQFVASFLGLQKRRVAARPEVAGQAFDDARARLEMMASVHRRLYDPANIGLTMANHIRHLCEETLKGSGAANIQLDVRADAIELQPERTMTLSLFIVELVTNAVKHAFEPSQTGRIVISLAQQDENHAVLLIEDDGRGMPDVINMPPESSNLGQSSSLGHRILQGFVSQLRGQFSYLPNQSGARGTTACLVFPITETSSH